MQMTNRKQIEEANTLSLLFVMRKGTRCTTDNPDSDVIIYTGTDRIQFHAAAAFLPFPF
jgi:hypothetical protein